MSPQTKIYTKEDLAIFSECGGCKHGCLIYPLGKEKVNDDVYAVTLRCPPYDEVVTVWVDKEALSEIYHNASAGKDKLIEDLTAVEKINFKDWAETFIGYIKKDYIMPIDF